MKPSEVINRTALVRKLQDELDEYVYENFVTDPETGVFEGGSQCEEYRIWLEEMIEKITSFPPIALWMEKLPDHQGLWWWWNEDQDSIPIVVNIAFSGTDGSYFATQGQHGWNRFQSVSEMRGLWMPLHEPDVPEEST